MVSHVTKVIENVGTRGSSCASNRLTVVMYRVQVGNMIMYAVWEAPRVQLVGERQKGTEHSTASDQNTGPIQTSKCVRVVRPCCISSVHT